MNDKYKNVRTIYENYLARHPGAAGLDRVSRSLWPAGFAIVVAALLWAALAGAIPGTVLWPAILGPVVLGGIGGLLATSRVLVYGVLEFLALTEDERK